MIEERFDHSPFGSTPLLPGPGLGADLKGQQKSRGGGAVIVETDGRAENLSRARANSVRITGSRSTQTRAEPGLTFEPRSSSAHPKLELSSSIRDAETGEAGGQTGWRGHRRRRGRWSWSPSGDSPMRRRRKSSAPTPRWSAPTAGRRPTAGGSGVEAVAGRKGAKATPG